MFLRRNSMVRVEKSRYFVSITISVVFKGPEECDGNIDQLCYLHATNNSLEALLFYRCMFKAVFERYSTAFDASEACADSLPYDTHDKWVDCANENLGAELLAQAGAATNALKPSHEFIPWSTFAGLGSKDINDLSLDYFAWTAWFFWNYANL